MEQIEEATYARLAATFVAHSATHRAQGMKEIFDEVGPIELPKLTCALAQIAVLALAELYQGNLAMVEGRMLSVASFASIDEIELTS